MREFVKRPLFRWAILVVLGLVGVTAWGLSPSEREQPTVTLTPPAPPPKPAPRPKLWPTSHPRPARISDAALEQIHHEAYSLFLNLPGNGSVRMGPVYQRVVREWTLPHWSPGELDRVTTDPFPEELRSIHRDTVGIFHTYPQHRDELNGGLRVVPDEHGNKPPRRAIAWNVNNIELVGLLIHEEPTVYLPQQLDQDEPTLPRTRPLDLFELAGLESLRNGQDIFLRTREGVTRMLGAVRARQECLKCHPGSKTGDLLGAFSYQVRLAEAQIPHGYRSGIGGQIGGGQFGGLVGMPGTGIPFPPGFSGGGGAGQIGGFSQPPDTKGNHPANR